MSALLIWQEREIGVDFLADQSERGFGFVGITTTITNSSTRGPPFAISMKSEMWRSCETKIHCFSGHHPAKSGAISSNDLASPRKIISVFAHRVHTNTHTSHGHSFTHLHSQTKHITNSFMT